jgi:hypothetical protein
MPKQKIGRDIIEKKTSGLISSPKEEEEFEKWQEEQLAKEEEKEEKPKFQVKIKSKIPEEPEPSAEQLARERTKDYEEMSRLKRLGKLKVQKVVLKEEEE